MDIRPIRTDADHKAALVEIDRLWDAPEGSADGDKLEVLTTLAEVYENNRWPSERLSPSEMLAFAISDMGRTQAELADVLGSRAQASDILRGRRRVSLNAARKISEAWHVPIQLLVGPYAEEQGASSGGFPFSGLREKVARRSRVG